eukprot:TRINITY_DN5738_c0_g1_i4.p1 TRINITY_DN5738_c0_g1~~TRINITY_DN5738_c0_g1_i4.p1  ORF type:complete len:112 (+),score=3.58 TRINITY_DN5738_c0_g1_i4:607-942(+)
MVSILLLSYGNPCRIQYCIDWHHHPKTSIKLEENNYFRVPYQSFVLLMCQPHCWPPCPHEKRPSEEKQIWPKSHLGHGCVMLETCVMWTQDKIVHFFLILHRKTSHQTMEK